MLWSSLVAQRLKCLPAMWETWIQSLGWEDPLEKERATHSSILAWRIPRMVEPGGLKSMRSQRQIWQSDFTFTFTLMGSDAMILVFWILIFKTTFSLSSFTFLKSSFIFSSPSSLALPRFLPWGWCHLYMWIYWYLSQQSWFQLVFIPVQHFSWCTLHIS